MKRPIEGFHEDDERHWVADLSCGHSQHTRHNPPLAERPWVLSEEGRRSRIGHELDCVLCDRAEMPDGHAPYQRTKSFDEETVPKALTANHTTKRGVWALIHVERGALEYSIVDGSSPGGDERVELLEPGKPGLIVSEVEHRVKPLGDVSFYVEFWRKDARPR